MTKEEIRARVMTEDTFVNAKRFKNDLGTLEQRYPDGCPDHVIASALMIEEAEVETEYARITEKLRDLMGVEP